MSWLDLIAFALTWLEIRQANHFAWGLAVASLRRDATASRARAVWCCVWFGVRPWWLYEDEPHYDCGYWPHLWRNARYAARWLLGRETDADRAFEREVNRNPPREHLGGWNR